MRLSRWRRRGDATPSPASRLANGWAASQKPQDVRRLGRDQQQVDLVPTETASGAAVQALDPSGAGAQAMSGASPSTV